LPDSLPRILCFFCNTVSLLLDTFGREGESNARAVWLYDTAFDAPNTISQFIQYSTAKSPWKLLALSPSLSPIFVELHQTTGSICVHHILLWPVACNISVLSAPFSMFYTLLQANLGQHISQSQQLLCSSPTPLKSWERSTPKKSQQHIQSTTPELKHEFCRYALCFLTFAPDCAHFSDTFPFVQAVDWNHAFHASSTL
jgi:hypothetical protein